MQEISQLGFFKMIAVIVFPWLAFLDKVVGIEGMNRPGYRLHKLEGKLTGRLAINVSGNWRITFEFEDGDAYIVNYEDYH